MTDPAHNPESPITSSAQGTPTGTGDSSSVIRVSPESLKTTLSTLEALVRDPNALAAVPIPEWKELLVLAGQLSRPNRDERRQRTKAMRRFRKKTQLEVDLKVRGTTKIREERGPLLDRDGTQVFPAPRLPGANIEAPEARVLREPQACYVCKAPYTVLHFFYDCLCPGCAELNWAKRSQTADLRGRVALITGARIKIGFCTSLMLLRAGATVIATTRFPQDAAQRYAKEPDFEAFKDRLSIYGLDLRHCPSVELLAEHLQKTTDRLDFLINNAAQTVHRPLGFYEHLRAREEMDPQALPAAERDLLRRYADLKELMLAEAGAGRRLAAAKDALTTEPHQTLSRQSMTPLALTLGLIPAELDEEQFPPNRFDADGQQVDLRSVNSWRMKAQDVDTPELIEVHLVNAIAPFILVSRLKSLMERTDNRDKHIVNVSAMEGCFSRRMKTDRHPHTNMAKASLNMLTRTSAQDYLESGIHMNSVDTGWVTDEDPHQHQVRKRTDYDFHPPLDAIDGAARVCDPIFVGYQTGEHPSGLFFKDYGVIKW
ncbi:MAG: SDR family oxidoreductase [Polyangiaceae bacterium]|nr:SDR family oxidoreductase [Polyangiaceae bacterium]